ncbi:MAG: hypothetical protein KAU01_10175 [Candidatus Cloacimonetes bacterium]|nr:hypothetical protein [Candidatus Cloacimonadota bacterium]
MVKNLNKAKEILKTFCLVTNHIDKKELINKPKFWINKYGPFTLDKKDTAKFYNVAEFIRLNYDKGQLAENVSKKDIERFLLEYISEVFTLLTQNDKLKAIDNFEVYINKNLKSKIENYEIFSPILNFKTKTHFIFGDMKFYPFTNDKLIEEIEFIENLYSHNNVIKEENKKEGIELCRMILSTYLNQTMFKCSFTGTTIAAKSKSYYTALLNINVLKFLYYDIKISKPEQNDILPKNKRIKTIMKTNDSFITTNHLPIEFNSELFDLSLMKTEKAISLSRMLEKEVKDDIDKRILASINWAINSIEKAPAITDESDFFDSSVYMTPNKLILSQCLLNVMIAFETLLLFKDENFKKKRLKIRSVILLENTNFEKTFIKDKIEKLYKLRSKIVHEGKFNESPQAVYQLYIFFRDIVFELIALKNKEKIETNAQLKKWFKDKETMIQKIK